MKNLKGKRAVLYRRVSTTDQKDYGNSLNSQSQRLYEFCNRNSMEVIKDYEEDYSAKNISRPSLSKLIKFVTQNKHKVDFILIQKWDRFSRNDNYRPVERLGY